MFDFAVFVIGFAFVWLPGLMLWRLRALAGGSGLLRTGNSGHAPCRWAVSLQRGRIRAIDGSNV